MIDLAASLEATGRQSAEGCVKTWEDLARYERIIAAVRPAVVIELGTFSGKSALWFARRPGTPMVVTVDINDSLDPETREAWEEIGSIIMLRGSSTDLDVVEQVWMVTDLYAGAAPVLLVLDSDHSADHVAAEMAAYSGLVTPGSYMVVEDTLLRWMPAEERAHYDGTPLDAVEAWMAEHGDEWVSDLEIEGLHPTTQHPSGFLRRR